MPRRFAMSLFAAACLAACSGPTEAPAAPAPAAGTDAATASAAASAHAGDAAPAPPMASVAGAIRNGNRAAPAMRACAHPLDGGVARCVDVAGGAGNYRIELAPGRYHLLGWPEDAAAGVFAHARQVRCIRAPCPPDELVEVDAAAGEQRDGIDLRGGYPVPPDGWPRRPA